MNSEGKHYCTRYPVDLNDQNHFFNLPKGGFWMYFLKVNNLGMAPLPLTVTTGIITFLVGDPYKPSFPTVTGKGDNPMNN